MEAGGNLGAPPKPPQRGLERGADPADSLVQQRRDERLPGRLRLARGADRIDQRAGLADHVGAPLAVRVGDADEQLPEARQPVPRLGREVRAAEERLAGRRQEDRHRPAAAAGEGDDGVHVDGVEVGTLLAVDLDADEALVHEPAPSPRPRTTRAPSRGTSGTPSSRSRAAPAGPRPGPARTPPRPRGTSRPGCRRAAGGTGSTRRPDGSRAGRYPETTVVDIQPRPVSAMMERVRNTAPIGLLALAILAGGCASSKHQAVAARAAGPAVPWTAERPRQLAERHGTAPPCRAADLIIADKAVQFAPNGEGGIAVVAIRNNGDRACSLGGRPTVRMVKQGGPRQVQVSPAASPPTFPYVSYPASTLRQALRPGENAGADRSPGPTGAIRRSPASRTSRRGRSASRSRTAGAACPPTTTPCRVLRAGRSVEDRRRGLPAVPGHARDAVDARARPGADPGAAAPRARRGGILRYRVVLNNLSGYTGHFTTCPAYVQQLAPAGKIEAHRLNCAKAHPITPGKRGCFAMQLRVTDKRPARRQRPVLGARSIRGAAGASSTRASSSRER